MTRQAQRQCQVMMTHWAQRGCQVQMTPGYLKGIFYYLALLANFFLLLIYVVILVYSFNRGGPTKRKCSTWNEENRPPLKLSNKKSGNSYYDDLGL